MNHVLAATVVGASAVLLAVAAAWWHLHGRHRHEAAQRRTKRHYAVLSTRDGTSGETTLPLPVPMPLPPRRVRPTTLNDTPRRFR